MDHNGIVQLVGIIFVTSSLVRGFKIWTFHLEEKQRIRLTANTQGQQLDQSAIEDLRGEIMRLRDTTTQYDMSVEKTLSEIKNRVDHLEAERLERPLGDYKSVSDEPQRVFQQVGDVK